jgi:hypothetical protein
MKQSIALSVSLIIGLLAANTGRANAVVYCQYAGYPAGCAERSSVAPILDARKMPAAIDVHPRGLVRQDLFDRNNPNNLRPDWPSPPSQPGGFGR